MSMVLGHLGAALIVGQFVFCTVFALAAARGSSRISRNEEVELYKSRYPANQN
ncbi:hypothetical protein [Rhizobium ruizarguesonis]|uniref:hypothetical protein n=1 Tax=Rhizobium ruizarguesonis TaxID=2081791 RepID=UPI000403FAE5|nr:hypothetical protein [Rhizobium ruizarguesonis]QJS27441.1 hypothetical protein RLTA1_09140 [Rhizobium leguminosarum bv. trifolii TA1]UFW96191.1 hypothetical protein RlegTA1_09105 [Rhizobium ruizarguesonis]